MKLKLLLSLAAFTASAFSASAITVFSDNFDSESPSTNYSSFLNWDVVAGTVDVIDGFTYLTPDIPGHGLMVDLDGSNNTPGKIVLKTALTLAAGKYTLSYELAGNHRQGSGRPLEDSAQVLVETGIDSAVHTLSQLDGFQLFTLDFTLASTTDVSIAFEGLGNGDNVGLLLDNVSLESHSVPDASSTVLLLGLAFAGLGVARRKLR